MGRVKTAPARPTPGAVSPWVLIGYLASTIEAEGRISVEDWNNGVRAAVEQQRHEDALVSR